MNKEWASEWVRERVGEQARGLVSEWKRKRGSEQMSENNEWDSSLP